MLSPEIQVESDSRSIRYNLPIRPLGKLRWAGLFLIGFGFLFVMTPLEGALGACKRAVLDGTPFNWVFLLFMVPFLLAGLAPIGFGLLTLCGRCRVEWCDKRLSIIESVGPFRWRRRIANENRPVRRFLAGSGKTIGKDNSSGAVAGLGILVAELDPPAKRRVMILGYPQPWLVGLAEDLSRRIGVDVTANNAPNVEAIRSIDSEALETQAIQPPNSRVAVERGVGWLRLAIPPLGMWGGAKSVTIMALAWCAFMAVFTGLFALAPSAVPGEDRTLFLLVILAFWGVGIVLLGVAANMGKRRVLIQVESGRLTVTTTGPFGVKKLEFRHEDLAAIRADNSRMEVNDHPIPELQLHPVKGKKTGLLAARDNAELRWIAAELRQTLKLPSRRSEDKT